MWYKIIILFSRLRNSSHPTIAFFGDDRSASLSCIDYIGNYLDALSRLWLLLLPLLVLWLLLVSYILSSWVSSQLDFWVNIMPIFMHFFICIQHFFSTYIIDIYHMFQLLSDFCYLPAMLWNPLYDIDYRGLLDFCNFPHFLWHCSSANISSSLWKMSSDFLLICLQFSFAFLWASLPILFYHNTIQVSQMGSSNTK